MCVPLRRCTVYIACVFVFTFSLFFRCPKYLYVFPFNALRWYWQLRRASRILFYQVLKSSVQLALPFLSYVGITAAPVSAPLQFIFVLLIDFFLLPSITSLFTARTRYLFIYLSLAPTPVLIIFFGTTMYFIFFVAHRCMKSEFDYGLPVAVSTTKKKLPSTGNESEFKCNWSNHLRSNNVWGLYDEISLESMDHRCTDLGRSFVQAIRKQLVFSTLIALQYFPSSNTQQHPATQAIWSNKREWRILRKWKTAK